MSINTNHLGILNFSLERVLPLINQHTQQTAYTLKTTPKNTLIYPPYQNHNKVYLLKSGRVKIGVKSSKGIELIHQIVWSGEVFGENTLFQKQASNQFAQTLEECTYYEIDAEALSKFLWENRWVQGYFLELFAKNLQKAERRLYDFVGKDAPVRIIDFLMEIGQEKGIQNGVSYELSPFFSQIEVASIVGCSAQMVGLVLRDLKKKSLVKYGKKQLVINHIHKLRFRRNEYCKSSRILVQELQIEAIERSKRKSA